MSAYGIVKHLAKDYFEVIQTCSNAVPGVNLSNQDIYATHAVYTMMTLTTLSRIEEYWKPPR
jgi:hypothetical protein